MGIQIGQKPSPTFQQPLELLSDCHRRIENFLRALSLVTEQAKDGALNPQQRDALQTALRYFREAAPKHTADEEESLFPRMRRAEENSVHAALQKIEKLEADHAKADHGHALVERLGQKWLRENALSADDLSQISNTLNELQEIYRGHIEVEDKEVFPLAAKVLNARELSEVGSEMAARRGLPFSRK